MLAQFVGPDFGLNSWRVHAVHHRVGGGVSVGYSVCGEVGEAYVVASTARVDEGRLRDDGGEIFDFEGRRYFVWRYPFDPQLPALPLACDPQALSEFIGESVEIELLAYRPTRRAVVRADGNVTYFAKVVPTSSLAAVVGRLELARESMPSPQVVRISDDGLVLTRAVPGVPLSRFLASRPSLPDADAMFSRLAQLVEGMGEPITHLKRRKAWAERAGAYGRAAGAALPAISRESVQLGERIEALIAATDFGPLVPTHGDFYEANVFVDPASWQISGVIDIDTLGPGYRAHDWGCLLGHMSVLEDLSPQRYRGIGPVVERWRDLAAREVGPAALGASAAGVVLSLVAGPAKARKRGWEQHCRTRLAIANEWMSYAQAGR